VRIGLQITIVALAAFAILGELGINILPILAGAGVVGLAIGFGAQTLVKDIISGVFFLVDDAFRKGEYIDIGSVKGTVEKISLRSMQLRHHNGPLHTIPFGDIRHVTNFSRDWVIMKLKLRLTYDTDPEMVRKLIKKLGQEMMEDPALGPLFLQPLKSQGVIEMEDSAQIMRVKFMTRPGDQWGLRRVVFARLHDLFEEHGIRFASREVVVRVENPSGEMTTDDRAALGAAAERALQMADGAVSGGTKN
jgi:small-conductance mechanosensitive channel